MHVLDYRSRWKRRPPREVWSARGVGRWMLLATLCVGVPVIALGSWPAIVRVEGVLGASSVALWATLAVGLYRGVRVRRDESTPPFESPASLRSRETFDWTPDLSFDLDCLGGLLLGLLLLIALIFFWPLLVDAVAYLCFAAVGGVTWLMHRPLRHAFARAPRCRGRLGRSVGYASLFTFAYVGWLVAATAATGILLR